MKGTKKDYNGKIRGTMALTSVDIVRKRERSSNRIKRGVFSNGGESQNVEFSPTGGMNIREEQ
jgi:hypothetical protein